MAADYMTGHEQHVAGEGNGSSWYFWDGMFPSASAARLEDALEQVHFTSTRMTEFLLDTPYDSTSIFSSHSNWPCEDNHDDRIGDPTEKHGFSTDRGLSLSSFDSDESLHSVDSEAEHTDRATVPINSWAITHADTMKWTGNRWPVNVHAMPFVPKSATQKTLEISSMGLAKIWGPPTHDEFVVDSDRALYGFHGYHMQFPSPSESMGKQFNVSRLNRSPFKTQGVFPGINRNRKGPRTRDSFPIDTFDIENGLCIPDVSAMCFVNGRKVVRFFSKRTSRRTIVSIIDPHHLLASQEEIQEGEIGFLTFHDCVELRTLKTGETLTRNQRNNLRKRLATTARTIVQVDVPQLLQDFCDPDCCPRSTYHHSKLNAYLITPAVAQVLLCTREIDLTGEPYKGQTLAVQTLFDLSKNENAGAALREFIKSQQGLDLNVRDFKGMCPIHYAAKGGFKDIIETLLELGVDVNVKDKSDQSPLHYAIYNGHAAVQFQLLGAGARVDVCNVSGNTLLHVAAYHNQAAVAKAILQRCPELKSVRNHKFNSTPLECAVHKGLEEMALLLSPPA